MAGFCRKVTLVAGVTVVALLAYRALVRARTEELYEFLDEEDFWDDPLDSEDEPV